MITLYNLPSTCLEMPGLLRPGSFDTRAQHQKVAAPTGVRPDGSPRYTVPVILDDSTSSVVSESVIILELDKIYPDSPTLIPPGTKALNLAFRDAAANHIQSLRQFIITPSYSTMTPVNRASLRHTLSVDVAHDRIGMVKFRII